MTQEKVSLNLTAVDLAKVDYLVEQGFYSSRSDFLRAAIRSQLLQHEAVISDKVLQNRAEVQGTRNFTVIGVGHLGRRELEKALADGRKWSIFVVGSLFLDKEISADLFKETVESSRVYGVLKGPPEVVALIRSEGKS